MRHILRVGIILGLATAISCGGENASGAAGDGDGDGDGDGNVGFGGAQDIGQFRNILENGQIPGPNTLDANGFFSEHRTELPPADCGETLCAHGMLAVGTNWVNDAHQSTLQVSLNTPNSPNDIERLPLNLVVVVDTSGSMVVDDRIGFVKQGLHLLVDELQPGDRLGVVTYSSSAAVRRSVSEDPVAEDLHALVDSLNAAGGTNIHDGLELGFQQIADNLDPQRQNRVILLSDGLATAGIVDDELIISMSESFIELGIGLTTIGVGIDFNVDLMRGLAERGAGNFYFVENSSAVTEVFTEELDYFVSPLALSVLIEVEAAPGYALGDVAGTRLWKTSGPTGSVFLPAVFLASRTDDSNPNGRRGGGSALFIDMSATGGVTEPGPIAIIRLSYILPGTTTRLETEIVVQNPHAPGETPDNLFVSRAAMTEHYAIYNAYLGLLRATELAERGDYNCAAGVLGKVRGRIVEWNTVFIDSDIGDDVELFDMFVSNLEAQGAIASEECGVFEDDWEDDWGDGDWEGGGTHYHTACSIGSGGGASGGLLVLLALIPLWRRRRTS